MTAAAGREAGTGAPREARPTPAAADGHEGIVRSLRHVDWLVLLVAALYVLVRPAGVQGGALLYGAMGTYAAFLAALRWPRFPVKDAGPRVALGAAVMVAFITVVAARTGGADSPMAGLFLLPVVVAAMTLRRRGALVAFAAVALAWVSLVAGAGPLPPASELLARLAGELGPWALVAWLVQSMAGSVTSARRQIAEMAERDGLTGMLNLRTFKEILRREHELRARAGRGGYGLLQVDMDDLKSLNDQHGHQAGNRAIAAVAAAIQRAIRASDTAARSGGDEFIVFLPEATTEVAESVAQRIRKNVYGSLFPVGERLQRMSVSVGAASYPRDGTHPEDVLAAALARVRRDRELRKGAESPA